MKCESRFVSHPEIAADQQCDGTPPGRIPLAGRIVSETFRRIQYLFPHLRTDRPCPVDHIRYCRLGTSRLRRDIADRDFPHRYQVSLLGLLLLLYYLILQFSNIKEEPPSLNAAIGAVTSLPQESVCTPGSAANFPGPCRRPLPFLFSFQTSPIWRNALRRPARDRNFSSFPPDTKRRPVR